MSQYLDSDALRRQDETMVRMTVVATVGLIGVATTGVLGMNLFALGEEPMMMRLVYFLLVLIPVITVTLYTVLKSETSVGFSGDTCRGASVVWREAYGIAGCVEDQTRMGFLTAL